jgi:hypothetical protein
MMPSPSPSLSPFRSVAAPLLVAGLTTGVVFAAGLVSGHTLFAASPATGPAPAPAPAASSAPSAASSAPSADSCGLPAGITLDALQPADRSFALRRGFLCADLQAGRIARDEYRTRLALLDSTTAHLDLATGDPPATDLIWASTLRAFSSQYTDADWSAARALGPPDVPTGGGDHPNAWAPADADAGLEFVEVGFDRPRRIDGLDIVESHNAGAVTRVELVTSDGIRSLAYSAAAAATSPFRHHIDLPCTDQPIASVRVTLDSAAIPDWNEIDAIGIHPCR